MKCLGGYITHHQRLVGQQWCLFVTCSNCGATVHGVEASRVLHLLPVILSAVASGLLLACVRSRA